MEAAGKPLDYHRQRGPARSPVEGTESRLIRRIRREAQAVVGAQRRAHTRVRSLLCLLIGISTIIPTNGHLAASEARSQSTPEGCNAAHHSDGLEGCLEDFLHPEEVEGVTAVKTPDAAIL